MILLLLASVTIVQIIRASDVPKLIAPAIRTSGKVRKTIEDYPLFREDPKTCGGLRCRDVPPSHTADCPQRARPTCRARHYCGQPDIRSSECRFALLQDARGTVCFINALYQEYRAFGALGSQRDQCLIGSRGIP